MAVCLISIALVVHGTPLLQGDRQARPEPAQFRTAAELVLVPVVVLDKNRKHVSGLTAADFEITEKGKVQKIATFEEVTASKDVSRLVIRHRPGEFTNAAASGAPTAKQLIIIVVDLVNTGFTDQARGRHAMIEYLSSTLVPGSPIALLVMHRNGVRLVHDFTQDPALIVAAVRRIKGETPPGTAPGRSLPVALVGTGPSLPEGEAPAVTSPDAYRPPTEQQVADSANRFLTMMTSPDAGLSEYERFTSLELTMDAFQHIARTFAMVPGRKSLIWATGSFPFILLEARDILDSRQAAIYERTFKALNDANIAVYPVDIRGLAGSSFGDIRGCTSCGGLGFSTVGVRDIQTNDYTLHSSLSTLDTVAEMTGGQAFYNTNDLPGSFREAANESASYYMLGYYLTQKVSKAEWRPLKVRVLRPDLKVRARNGFFALPEKPGDPGRDLELVTALRSPLDYNALPVTVRWTGIDNKSGGGKRNARFEIVLDAGVASVAESDSNHLSLEFAGVARSQKGETSGQFRKGYDANLSPEALEQIRGSGITYNGAIALPAGEYSVRFVVRDNISGRMGSVLAPLAVP
ncbi:MAG TPA: VWA domain-containing protein [Terriglobales bacterium]|nr:VWA domain-containing protein [Terriglobales bacterium]